MCGNDGLLFVNGLDLSGKEVYVGEGVFFMSVVVEMRI